MIDNVHRLGLDGYVPEARWRAENGDISRRTLDVYMSQGLPNLLWGGKLYIPEALARAWIDKRVRNVKSQTSRRRRA